MKYLHLKRFYNRVYSALKNCIVYWLIPDKWYLSWKFKKVYGRTIDWDNPRSFNEKIQWLKLHDRNLQYHLLVDKLRAKKIVADIIGSTHVIPNLTEGYKSLTEIEKDTLPEKFVIKCNHDAASVMICKDKSKFDWDYAEYKMKWCMAHDYYHYENKQWAYKDIDRCIFVEQYMEDSEVHELRDYKFFCFNGKVKCFKIDYNRHTNHQANYYDAHGKMLSIIEELCPPNIEKNIEVPDNIEEMIKMSEKLAKLVNNPFVRIDFYNVNGHIYFGEFTFYPDGGFGSFKPEKWDYILGSWIDLNSLKNK